jgi:hypothetical protein
MKMSLELASSGCLMRTKASASLLGMTAREAFFSMSMHSEVSCFVHHQLALLLNLEKH